MNRILSVCMVFGLFFVNVSAAQGINGEWTGKMEGNEEPFDIFLTFKVNVDTLTGTDTLAGTIRGPMGTMPIHNGKVSGKDFSFDVLFGRATINHQCTLLADSISMRYVGMEGKTREIILKRALHLKQ